MYKNINDDLIEIITNFLNEIKHKQINISIIPPHIEEIYSFSNGKVYGKAEMTIHVVYDDIYQKTNNILSTWVRINEDSKRNKKRKMEDFLKNTKKV